MRKSLVIETLYEVSIAFRKESFINAKKILNFIQSLTNEKKLMKSLTAFHNQPTNQPIITNNTDLIGSYWRRSKNN